MAVRITAASICASGHMTRLQTRNIHTHIHTLTHSAGAAFPSSEDPDGWTKNVWLQNSIAILESKTHTHAHTHDTNKHKKCRRTARARPPLVFHEQGMNNNKSNHCGVALVWLMITYRRAYASNTFLYRKQPRHQSAPQQHTAGLLVVDESPAGGILAAQRPQTSAIW